MSPTFGHQTLQNRRLYRGRLELMTPLRLSSGRASDQTDAPIMRGLDRRPVIPGSSLRGALRSELERLLAGLAGGSWPDGGEVPKACTLFTQEGSCLSVNRERQTKLRELEEKSVRAEATREQKEEPMTYLEDNLCDLCKLFGSPVYASRLVIDDAYPEQGGELNDRTIVRDGVGIDRDTGTARDNVKFNYEVLEPGKTQKTCFKVELRVENVGETDEKLLWLVERVLANGLYLGGKRAAGLGRVRLEGGFQVERWDTPEALWQQLLGKPPAAEEDAGQGGR